MLSLVNNDLFVITAMIIGTWLLHGYIQERRENPSNLPLPPGPRSYPFVGSFFTSPTYKVWLEYDKWFKIYGDMVYFKVFGSKFLILGSHERAYDLLERGSTNYSDRPRLVMLNELMGWDYDFAFHQYGTWWRRHRRHFHDYFHPNVIHKYHPILLDSSRTFLCSLLGSPEKFVYNIRYTFADSILKVIYGADVRENESYVGYVEAALAGLAAAGTPGSFLVDIFPFMKMIPAWFPGAEWKRKARETGTAEPCIATELLDNLPNGDSAESKEEEVIRRNTCAAAFVGGSDTTVSTVTSFFMAMALYPEVQKKAHAELDRILGGRLPEFSDRPHLPYINALIKESTRWQPVGPLGVPHTSSDADEFNGFYIPKGTNVIVNSWSILHDPVSYKDPFVYNPDRFLKNGELDPSVRDPIVTTFGFGRRICPGRFLSDAGLFATIAHVLTVFDIRPNLDKDGNEVKIVPNMTSGLVSYPETFECRITPRSTEAEKLIRTFSLNV